jgi:hypothetical protein
MANLILALSMVIPVAFVGLCLVIWRLWRRLDKRRSPLTFAITNLPGEYLRRQVAKHDDAFMESAALVVSVGPLFLSAWLLARVQAAGIDWGAIRFGWGDFILMAFALALLGWSAWRLTRHAKARRFILDGLQAELAVAQCLTPLIAEGAMVFHDFPTGKGNIDHIVVGRSAVFAIETKWRRKPGYQGKDAARVQFDGRQLRFPARTESKPVEQAKYQAQWLEKFLASGVGSPVRVIPVLALPGWYVEQVNKVARPEVLVSNCHNAAFMVGDKFGPPMADELKSRIAHVLSEKYPPLDFI